MLRLFENKIWRNTLHLIVCMVLLVLPQIAYAGDQSPKNKKLIRVHELIDQADSYLTAGNYEQTRLFCKEANGLIKNRKNIEPNTKSFVILRLRVISVKGTILTALLS